MLSVKILRLKNRLSQEELAEKSGVSAIAISRIELGKQNPKPETLEKIAKALGVTVSYLLEYEKTINKGE